MLYPFSAIVGQEKLRLSLLLHAIDPLVGGVVIVGDRGTAKSTAVRALARLLPPMQTVAGCRFHCDSEQPGGYCTECEARRHSGETLSTADVQVPVVDLPLGTTEDRLIGSLDIEVALVEGRKQFSPGLLAQANRGFLYIDEVNLLEDHLVDSLLDVAASGINVVEREGISLRHPARFVLVGSCNPEEGDLRPQLLDRFGLYVRVETVADIEMRSEIIRRRFAFENDRAGFMATWLPAERQLTERIVAARQRLQTVTTPDAIIDVIARIAARLGLQGHRGEVTTLRAARAVAAWQEADQVEMIHLEEIAGSALLHRLPNPTHNAAAERDLLAVVQDTIRQVERSHVVQGA